MITASSARALRTLFAVACALAAPLAPQARAAVPDGVALEARAVRGLIVRLRDAPDHVPSDGSRRSAQAVRSDARWQALLASSGLHGERGLRLEPVGRNAVRVVFDRARSPAVVHAWVRALERQSAVQIGRAHV